jgi:hypothetical protein
MPEWSGSESVRILILSVDAHRSSREKKTARHKQQERPNGGFRRSQSPAVGAAGYQHQAYITQGRVQDGLAPVA